MKNKIHYQFRHIKLKHIVKAAGFSDKDLAERLDLNWTTVNRWLNPNYGHEPPMRQLIRVLSICGYKPKEIQKIKMEDFWIIDGFVSPFFAGVPGRLHKGELEQEEKEVLGL